MMEIPHIKRYYECFDVPPVVVGSLVWASMPFDQTQRKRHGVPLKKNNEKLSE
jgi:hypothetical protein